MDVNLETDLKEFGRAFERDEIMEL